MARNPVWACPSYNEHGQWAVCVACLERFRKRGGVSEDLPPPVEFGRGWFSVGAVHWFAATDSTVYVARDGRRVLAQAACGGICDVTTARAPRPKRECRRCLRALGLMKPAFTDRPGTFGVYVRIYRGLPEPYDASFVSKDRRFRTDFTDSAFWALHHADSPRGTVLVLDIPEDVACRTEEEWIGTHARRFSLRGGFDEYIVAQIPARDLSDEIRRRGVAEMNDKAKSDALAQYVESRLVHSEIPNVGALQH